MVLPAVVELRLGLVSSNAINSDFFKKEIHARLGLEDEVELAGIENPITEDVGRVLRAGPEDAADEQEEEVGVRRRSAHDFLTTNGTSGGGAGVEGEEVSIGTTTLETGTEEEDSTPSPGYGVEALSSSSAVSVVVS